MTVIERGMKLTGNQVEFLPPTSRVEMNGSEYLRKPNGKWMQLGFPGNNWTRQDFTSPGSVLRVTFIPVPAEIPDRMEESFDTWEQRFLTAVRTGANNNGVREETINRAFRDIGLDTTRTAVEPRNPGDITFGNAGLQRAPRGTLVSVVSTGLVYEKQDVYWWRKTPTPEQRDRNLPGESVMLVRWGTDGPTDVTDVVVPEADRIRLKQTKAKAWKVAMRMKSQHSWCSTLESIVNSGGVYATDAMGDGMNKETQRQQPEGTLFFWYDVNAQEWAILRRENHSRNMAGTTRVVGTSSANTGAEAELVQRPGGEFDPPSWISNNQTIDVRQIAHEEFAGTRFMVDTSRFIICTDGTVAQDPGDNMTTPGHGQWTATSFGTNRATFRLVTLEFA